MYKTLFYLLLISLIGCAKGQFNLKQDYKFIGIDGEVRKLHKRNDTIYLYKCFIDRPCIENSREHYKIVSSITDNEITVFKLEKLDSLQMTNDPYPETRYSLLILKNISNKELGVLQQNFGLTKNQIDTLHIVDAKLFKDKFFFTFFSDVYYNELFALKKIITKTDAEEVVEEIKNPKYKHLIDTYTKTKVYDMYASGITAELLNKACIEKGFSPIGAGIMINKLMKDEKR